MTLALIDYGAGNLHSVANALRAAGKGKFATVWSGQAQSRPANAAS